MLGLKTHFSNTQVLISEIIISSESLVGRIVATCDSQQFAI